jgi:drug/metabolite transporter (DMT)-like permease
VADARPGFAFAACCAVWGTTFLVIKSSNDAFAPLWGAALRLALAALILAAVWLVRRDAMPRGRVLLVVVLFGLFDFGINLGLLYWGERSVPSGLSAVFYATVPVVTLLLARLVGQEKLDAWKLAGMLAAFAGVIVVFASELTARADPWALVAILGAAASAALSSVLLRTIPPQPVVPTVTLGCAASAALLLVGSLVFGETWATPSSLAPWWPILYLAVLGSIVAFGLFTWLLNVWPASSATLVGVIVPVVAVTVGAVAARERLALTTLAGGALVLAGVAMALLRARRLDRRTRAPHAEAR